MYGSVVVPCSIESVPKTDLVQLSKLIVEQCIVSPKLLSKLIHGQFKLMSELIQFSLHTQFRLSKMIRSQFRTRFIILDISSQFSLTHTTDITVQTHSVEVDTSADL
jgi:hypothetical protein